MKTGKCGVMSTAATNDQDGTRRSSSSVTSTEILEKVKPAVIES